jgi:hypothetical protein
VLARIQILQYLFPTAVIAIAVSVRASHVKDARPCRGGQAMMRFDCGTAARRMGCV